MAEAKKFDFDGAEAILDEEDEGTLAAIDRGIKDADEGRVVPAEEVYERMEQWHAARREPGL
jgi:predicted transcriptional regulator